jgi:hypothetical protein
MYRSLNLEIDSNRRLRTKFYDKEMYLGEARMKRVLMESINYVSDFDNQT